MRLLRAAAWAVSGVILVCGMVGAEFFGWLPPEAAGRLPAEIKESSGLAVSRRDPTIFWTHEDSGAEPVLKAISVEGTLRGAVRITGVKNVDWEDMASFTLDGRAWLLVADTGDNRAARADCALYVIAEPDPATLHPGTEGFTSVAWRIPVIYPDGPRDCEAVAVDAKEERVYLLAKRVTPHGLYALPLRPVAKGAVFPAPERVGWVPAFPAAPESQRLLPIPSGMFRAQPTGMDFASDGSAAAVVTYGEVLVYPRAQDETWAKALAKSPQVLAPHGLPQAEAVAFGADGRGICVTSEGSGMPLLLYRQER